MTGKEVLRAIADGDDPSDFEWFNAVGEWIVVKADIWKLADFGYPKSQFRRKPRTRVVNGFTVPAPIQEMPKEGELFFLAMTDSATWFDAYRSENGVSYGIWLSRGLLFSTKEAAIANAKAMCGINPESEA